MKEKYIKSPLNYVGGKYKLLPQIIPLFPTKMNRFIDLFGGGFNVGINVNCDVIIYNDLCGQVVNLLEQFYTHKYEDVHKKIIETIEEYGISQSDINGYEYYGCNSSDGLSKYNKPKFLELRSDYNKDHDWIKFYTLIACSFSNQIRFNSKGDFNMPCGKRDYNKSIQEKLKLFVEELHKKTVFFRNKDFRYYNYNFAPSDFLYCDPPYLNSTATYNENGAWTEEDEKDLLALLDFVNLNGGRFALSNNLKYDNPLLDEWKKKYNVHYLNSDYSNCNYHKIDRGKDIEVLITNY